MSDQNQAPEFPSETPNKWFKNPATRAWIYGIAAACGAALVVLNIVTQEQVNAVLNIIGSALLVGAPLLALSNTPKSGR